MNINRLKSVLKQFLIASVFFTNAIYFYDLFFVLHAHVVWSTALPRVTVANATDEKLVTIFTTFKEGRSYFHHEFVHSLVLENWRNLSKNELNKVLFTSNLKSRLSELAVMRGWDVARVKRTNPSGAVYFRDMFQYAFDNYESTFYAYSNGDILYDQSLIETLRAVRSSFNVFTQNVLVIGRRTNMYFDEYREDILNDFSRRSLKNVSASSGSLFTDWGVDYFIFTKPHLSSFNWAAMADVVIGRIAYDNYVVAAARWWRVKRVDATRTLLALHLNKPSVDESGLDNEDANFNLDVIGRFDNSEGRIKKAEYFTERDATRFYILQKD